MATTKHIVQWGDSLVSIARYYGFGDVRPIAEHPDNVELLASAPLTPGDVLTIPEGTLGEAEYGTGRGHVVVVDVPPAEFELRVWVGFSHWNPMYPGDYSKMTNKWFPHSSSPIQKIEATVSLSNGASGSTNPNTGTWVSAPALGDGTWTLDLAPTAEELSLDCARADPNGDRTVPSKTPNNGYYQLELRPLSIAVEVLGGRIVNAFVRTLPPPARPRHAVLYWLNAPNVAANRQVLDVDWRPDFFRRVQPKVRPRIEDRGKSKIEIIELHHTAGTSMASGVGTFSATKGDSGAHFVIDLDGHVVRMCDDRYEVKHGGGVQSRGREASWDGKGLINKRSIGIEHVNDMGSFNPDKDSKKTPSYTDAQYEASIDLIRGLIAAHGVPLKNVIGHNDVVWKSACPGWSFQWPRLERAGVALGPIPVSPAEYEEMFGGFFSGPDGPGRRLPLHAEERVTTVDGVTTISVIDAKKKTIVAGLPGHPIVELQELLAKIGYTDNVKFIEVEGEIVEKLIDGKLEEVTVWTVVAIHEPAPKGEFGILLGFALRQFITHYCTGERLRPDLSQAYRDSPIVPPKLAVDFELAKLILRVARAVP